jgi:hypothetical protein
MAELGEKEGVSGGRSIGGMGVGGHSPIHPPTQTHTRTYTYTHNSPPNTHTHTELTNHPPIHPPTHILSDNKQKAHTRLQLLLRHHMQGLVGEEPPKVLVRVCVQPSEYNVVRVGVSWAVEDVGVVLLEIVPIEGRRGVVPSSFGGGGGGGGGGGDGGGPIFWMEGKGGGGVVGGG